MSHSEFLRRFEMLLAASHLSLPEGPWRDRLYPLYQDILAANQELNLTRIVNQEDFLIKHLIDSYLVLDFVPELICSPWRVADVGCGAGIPGLPLALLCQEAHFTEIDNSGKKAEYVAGLLTRLGLQARCTALHAKGRELARRPDHEGRYDAVIARAVSETPSLITECRRFLAPGGSLIAYKTPAQVDEERQLTAREARKAKLSVEESPIFQLPEQAGTRQFVRLRRE